MNQVDKPKVWIIENSKIAAHSYQQALSNTYDFREFKNFFEFKEVYLKTLRDRLSDIPEFIISELHLDDGNLIELFQDPKFPKNN